MNQIQELPINVVIPTPDNPRTIKANDPKVKELSESIKQMGVLEPVLVRPHPEKEGHYDLRAGERRLRAAELAGLAEIPAIVKTLTDDEALEVTVAENLQREDLSPLEEAKGVALLLKRCDDVEAIARSLGRTKSWVYVRAQLNNLSEKWRKAIANEKHWASEWPIAHLELIARLDQNAQDQYLTGKGGNHYHRLNSFKELEKEIGDLTRILGKAPFDPKDATLLPRVGACLECPKRASCQPELFGVSAQVAVEQDKCLDATCWDAKAGKAAAQACAELESEHGVGVLKVKEPGAGWYGGAAFVASERKNKRQQDWDLPRFERAKKSDAGAKPAVVTEGAKAGTKLWLRPLGTRDSEKRGKKSSSSPAKTRDRMTVYREKLAEIETRRRALVVELIKKKLGYDVSLYGKKSTKDRYFPEHLTLEDLVAAAVEFGVEPGGPLMHGWAQVEKNRKEPKELRRLLWEGLVWTIGSSLGDTRFFRHKTFKEAYKEAEKVCAYLALDFQEFVEQAAEALPLPKKPVKKKGKKAAAKPAKAAKPKKKAKKKKRKKSGKGQAAGRATTSVETRKGSASSAAAANTTRARKGAAGSTRKKRSARAAAH